MRNLSLITLTLLLLVACKKTERTPPEQPATALYFPPTATSQWETVTASSLNWDTSKIPDLYSYLQQQDSRAFIVLHQGKIVLEKYFGQSIQGTAAFNQNSVWFWASAGKTLTGFMVGKAQEDGYLNIADKTSQYLGTGWTNMPLFKENLITIRHQLTMTSGLDDVNDADNTNPSALIYKADAGSRWAYHNAPYTLVQKVVSNAAGQPFNSYFDTHLKNKIGMEGQWVANGFNHVYWSTARSMARFGILMQAKGKWNGTNILNDANYITQSTTTSQNINNAYGYLWWLNGKTSFMVPQSQLVFQGHASPNAPPDMFAALGKDGQILNIVPSKGLVVVRMGNSVSGGLVSLTLQDDIWAKLKLIVN